MAQLLDGKALAAELQTLLRARIAAMKPLSPRLELFRVGEDPASVVYVRNKEKTAAELGVRGQVTVLPEHTGEAALLERVRAANADPDVDGILVQLPLPKHMRPDVVTDAIDPAKDVDGLHPHSQGLLAQGRPGLIACTPLGVLALLRRHGIPLAGARVVVLGRSQIVGRPLSLLLGMKSEWSDATVTVVHSRSRDLAAICREADVLVAAMGQRQFVRGAMVKPGAAVVDVGIHRLDDPERPGKSRLVGDVLAAEVEPIAGWLSPVPGGVGPLTVTMLLANTVFAAERRRGLAAQHVFEQLASK